MDYMDYIGKTFGEILSDLRGRKGQVKLGSKDGGAFYWIGDCESLTDMNVEIIDGDLKTWAYKRVKLAQAELNRLINKKPTIEQYVKDIAENDDIEGCGSVEGYLDKLTEWIATVDKQKRTIPEKKRYCIERKPLLERKIEDAYPCIASWESETIILLLEGIEPGRFWDKLEAEGKDLDTSKYKENTDEQPDA